jgi:hypothetical protein
VGLISGILKLPLAPVTGTVWIADKILEAAETEYYDEGTIQEQLREIHERHEAGDISDEDAAQAEDALLERLLEGRARGVGR